MTPFIPYRSDDEVDAIGTRFLDRTLPRPRSPAAAVLRRARATAVGGDALARAIECLA